LLIVKYEGKELEIPFAEEFIVRFEPSNKLLEMKLPEGLLDVNAPMTAEERAQQRPARDQEHS
jgi:hypothetical protein